MSLSCSGLDGAVERCVELEEEVGGKEGKMVMMMMIKTSYFSLSLQLNLLSVALLFAPVKLH